MNEYDQTPYRGAPFRRTHVDHLATIARIFGMSPAPPNRCRVLELGCGDGGNLIPMAWGLPESQFLGIDLAATPITTARATAQQLQMRNCDFESLDLMRFPPASGQFDFIIAHGLYSWVPETVREKVLAICHAHLAPHGVAFISYNTYPGGYLRQLTRSMMLYHTRCAGNPVAKVKQGRALLRLAIEGHPEPTPYRSVLEEQLRRLELLEIGGIYHDDFAPEFAPFYFHQFMENARRHDLQFLSEADLFEMETGQLPESVAARFRALDHDILVREQYLDLIKGRFFRHTLLCRAELKLDRSFNPSRMEGLYASSAASPVSSKPILQSGLPEEFRIAGGAEIVTTSATSKAALLHLSSLWPRMAGVDEIQAAARARLAEAGIHETPAESLPAYLLMMYRIGLVNLRINPPEFVVTPGPRPAVSALVRSQANKDANVTSMLHESIQLGNPFVRQLLTLLDGTRDRNALLESLGRLYDAKVLVPEHEGVPVSSRELAIAQFDKLLDPALEKIARAALLLA